MRILTLAVIAVAACVPVAAQDKPQDPGLIIRGATLGQLVDDCQRQTGKRFVFDDQVNVAFMSRKVHVVIPQMPKTKEEYFAVFQSILQVNKLALVPVGKPGEEINKIVNILLEAGRQPYEVATAGRAPNDSYVSRIFNLQYITTQDLQPVLDNLTLPQNRVLVQAAGVVIVTDYDYNVKRIEEIIKALDVKRPDVKFETIQLKHALATDVESMLKDAVLALSRTPRPGVGGPPMVIPAQAGQPDVKIAADKRTNSIIVLADQLRLEQIRELIEKLDIETPFESSGIHTVHLRHTNAVDIVKTLNALYGIGTDEKGIPSGGSKAHTPGSTTGPTGSTGGAMPGTGVPSPSVSLLGGEPRIVADVKSNSIILITDRNTAETLKTLIKRLDQRRPQVLIKATVVEVRATDNFDLGIELGRAVDPTGRTTTLFHTQFGQSTIVPNGSSFDIVPIESAGLLLALVHDRFGNIGGLLHALKEKVNINVLDEPEVATIDNGSATMSVKQAIPVLQQNVTQSGIVQTTFREFAEASTTLTISPHISEGGYLRLDTTVKIEKFVGKQANPTIPPAKTSREITTNSIMVPNGKTVVIGGIVTQDMAETVTKIPILGDIPIFGALFKRTQETEEKRTLYIFITPYIMYDESFGDYKELTRTRKDDIEGMRSQALKNLTLEGRGEPIAITLFRFRKPGEEEK